MSNPEVLHAVLVGDYHADALTRLIPNFNQLIAKEFEKILAHALRKGIPNVFQLGDVGNKPVLSYEAMLSLMTVLKKYDGLLNIYFILGNHDWNEKGSHSLLLMEMLYKMGFFKTVHVITDPEQRIIDGVPVNFLSFPAKLPLPGARAVNLAHIEAKGSKRDNGSPSGSDFEAPLDEAYYSGHLHTGHDAGGVHFVGTPYQLNFGEHPHKSFTELQAKVKADGSIAHRSIRHTLDPAFKLLTLVVNTEADLKKLEESKPLDLYRLIIKNDVELPTDLLVKYPNVVKSDYFKSKKELEVLEKDLFVSDQDTELEGLSVLDGLQELLAKVCKLTPKEIDRALVILGNLNPAFKLEFTKELPQ